MESADAGLSAIFNATSPLWAALVAWVWLSQLLSGLSTRLIDELESAAEELPSFLKGRG